MFPLKKEETKKDQVHQNRKPQQKHVSGCLLLVACPSSSTLMPSKQNRLQRPAIQVVWSYCGWTKSTSHQRKPGSNNHPYEPQSKLNVSHGFLSWCEKRTLIDRTKLPEPWASRFGASARPESSISRGPPQSSSRNSCLAATPSEEHPVERMEVVRGSPEFLAARCAEERKLRG